MSSYFSNPSNTDIYGLHLNHKNSLSSNVTNHTDPLRQHPEHTLQYPPPYRTPSSLADYFDTHNVAHSLQQVFDVNLKENIKNNNDTTTPAFDYNQVCINDDHYTRTHEQLDGHCTPNANYHHLSIDAVPSKVPKYESDRDQSPLNIDHSSSYQERHTLQENNAHHQSHEQRHQVFYDRFDSLVTQQRRLAQPSSSASDCSQYSSPGPSYTPDSVVPWYNAPITPIEDLHNNMLQPSSR